MPLSMSALSSLTGCVESIKSTLQLLDSGISILDSGVNDFRRLAKVLQTTKHYELISELELKAAQNSLREEIAPEVEHLLRKVETQLERLDRKEQSLIAKADLQEGRLKQQTQRNIGNARRREPAVQGFEDASRKVKEEKERTLQKLTALRQKRDRLSYAVERLTLQGQQKERQLRITVAQAKGEGNEI
ncbi:MAG: hypothetical protein M1829_001853 [Trizodia sp. TS-e1964]|nr:MAG: hypothetical protein M1829_001853 [Trizodia sp. TS-e1964]